MRTTLKELGFALFFLLVIALVAVEAGGEKTFLAEKTDVPVAAPAGERAD